VTPADEKALRKQLKRAVRERDRLRAALRNSEQTTTASRIIASNIQDELERRILAQEETASALEVAKADAETANTAKTKLLASISHELRTPMNGVLGTTQLLAGSTLNPDQEELVDVLQGSTISLISLVDQLLDFAQLETGSVELKPETVRLSGLISKVASLHRANARVRGLEMQASIGQGLPEWVLLDQARLGQVLTNLIDNALRFTEEGRVVLGASKVEAGVRFFVRDTGPGIPAEILPELFIPFRQANAHVWKRQGGSGLGLSICSRLVERLGGSIEVQSELGVGTCFSFVIPLQAQSAPVEVTECSLDLIVGKRILVVDDNPVNRLIGARMLQSMGCEVLLAEGGQEAVDMAAEEGLDLILMDCSMPVVDGFEATRRIRALSGAPGCVPIVALTALAISEDRERCLQAGMDDFLPKPVLLPMLKETLSRWLTPEAETMAC
jgi:signal transduction histidine kinase/ActR/RegA family two-component response regulator